MHQVGPQKVSIEILGGLEEREGGVGQHGVVLANKAKRESLRVLIIPLRTNDVIVQAARDSQPVEQPEEYVGVVDPQRSAGSHRQRGVDSGASRDKWSYVVGRGASGPC